MTFSKNNLMYLQRKNFRNISLAYLYFVTNFLRSLCITADNINTEQFNAHLFMRNSGGNVYETALWMTQ